MGVARAFEVVTGISQPKQSTRIPAFPGCQQATVSVFWIFFLASPLDFPSHPEAGNCSFNVWMLLRLPWVLHAYVCQEEALFHHIQSEESVTSLTFLLDIEVHCRPSSGSQSGINPTSVYSGNTTLWPEVGTFCVSFRQLGSAKAQGSRLHLFLLKIKCLFLWWPHQNNRHA